MLRWRGRSKFATQLIPIPVTFPVSASFLNNSRAVGASFGVHRGGTVIVIVVPRVVALTVRRLANAHVEARALEVDSLRRTGRRGGACHCTNETERDD